MVKSVKITRAEHEKLKKDSSELDQKNQELAKLKAQLEKYQKRSPVKNKYSPSKKKKELNGNLVNCVKCTVKDFVFHYVKFIQNEKEERLCTKNTLKHLPVTLPTSISKQEFIEDYSDVVYTTIKSTAQAVQHNAKNKAKGMCFVL